MGIARLSFLIAVSLVAACSDKPDEAAETEAMSEAEPGPDMAPVNLAEPVAYLCGTRVVTLQATPDLAVMEVDASSYDLSRVPAASGARYEAQDGSPTFASIRDDTATVRLDGEDLPECTTAKSAWRQVLPLEAGGNEPGWNMTLTDDRLDLVSDYGRTEKSWAVTAAEREGDGWRIGLDGDASVLIGMERCADDATGMPHPYTVAVSFGEESLRGCGGEPKSLLTGGAWLVEEIAGNGILDGSRITLEFAEDDRVSGLAGCNRYAAPYDLTGEGLEVVAASATRKACAPALMEQEAAFLAALDNLRRFRFDDTGALLLMAGGETVLRARRAS